MTDARTTLRAFAPAFVEVIEELERRMAEAEALEASAETTDCLRVHRDIAEDERKAALQPFEQPSAADDMAKRVLEAYRYDLANSQANSQAQARAYEALRANGQLYSAIEPPNARDPRVKP